MPRTPSPDITIVQTRHVSCDGGGGALGHPKVYMHIGEEGFVVCKYCDKRFELKRKRHQGFETFPS